MFLWNSKYAFVIMYWMFLVFKTSCSSPKLWEGRLGQMYLGLAGTAAQEPCSHSESGK